VAERESAISDKNLPVPKTNKNKARERQERAKSETIGESPHGSGPWERATGCADRGGKGEGRDFPGRAKRKSSPRKNVHAAESSWQPGEERSGRVETKTRYRKGGGRGRFLGLAGREAN